MVLVIIIIIANKIPQYASIIINSLFSVCSYYVTDMSIFNPSIEISRNSNRIIATIFFSYLLKLLIKIF
jgi:hypothetical protein